MGKDSAAGIELSRSFHQEGTFNVKVSESDFVPLWDEQQCVVHLQNTSFYKSVVMNLGKGVQSQRWFCRQTLMP